MSAAQQHVPAPLTVLDVALHVTDDDALWPGARVFPVGGPGKTGKQPAACLSSWKRQATRDPEQIRAWFGGGNPNGYGVGCTGIYTIDSDVSDDGQLAVDEFGPWVNDAVVWEGQPGHRAFAFRQPDPERADGVWAGGQIKGTGYMVLPPSQHDSPDKCPLCARGEYHEYVWLNAGGPTLALPSWPEEEHDYPTDVASGNDVGQIKVPTEWLTEGEPCAPVERALMKYRERVKSGRHDAARDTQMDLLRLGHQRHVGVRAAMNALYVEHRAAVSGEWTPTRERDFLRAAMGAAGKIDHNPTEEKGRHGCRGSEGCGDAPHLTPALTDVEEAVFGATEVLAGVRQAARAGYTSPWAVLGGALALVSAHTPHGYITPRMGAAGSLNLYVGMVGASGVGKSTGWAVARKHLNPVLPLDPDVNHPNPQVKGNPTGEGLLAAFMRRNPDDETRAAHPYVMADPPNVIVHVDEVEQLSASSSRAGSTLDPILRTMWTGGAVGSQTADSERRRNLPDGSYRIACVVGIQPNRAGHLLNGAAQDSGTAQRWLWMPAIDPDRIKGHNYEEVPSLDWSCPTIEFDRMGWSQRLIPLPVEVWEQVRTEREARVMGEAVGLDAHSTLQRIRVAACLALLHGETEVSDAMWEVAGHVMAVSDATRASVLRSLSLEQARSHEAEGRKQHAVKAAKREADIEAGAQAFARMVARHDHPKGGCTRACWSRAGRIYRDMKEEVVERAVSTGLVVTADGKRFHTP